MFSKVKEVFRFSLPIIIGQLGIMLIGAGDVFVAGQFSTETLAAIGVANGIQGPIIMLGVGLLMGITPVLSQLRGEGHRAEKELKVVLLYAFLTSLILMAINYSVLPFLKHFGFKKELLPFIREYLFVTGVSYPGIMLYQALKEYLQSQEKTIIANSISIFSVLINILGNFALVFGWKSIPSYGETGLAYMSVFTRVFLGIGLLLYTLPMYQVSYPASLKILKRITRLSLPISLSVLAEVFAFSFVSILVGGMGTLQAATHNIILTIASISFMVPLSISSAAAVKVGHSFGKENKELIKKYAFASILLSCLCMSVSAVVYITLPNLLLSLFTNDQQVIELGISLLVVVAFFQLFDGLQITLAGILRGISVSRSVLIATLISHWLIGFPIGRHLAYGKEMLAHGLWIGLAIGLFTLSISLSGVLYHNFKRLNIFMHPPK